MDNKELKVYTVVYETCNFTKAAESLYLTPQGVSKIVKRLESELDCLLFLRNSKGLTATKNGSHLYSYAIHALKEYDVLINQIEKDGSYKEQLRVVFPTGLLTYLTLEYLNEYHRQYPNVEFHYQECFDSDIPAVLDTNLADIAISPAPIDMLKYNAIHFTRNERVAVINASHPLASKDKLSFKDLDSQDLMMLGPKYYSYNEYLNLLAQSGSNPGQIFPTYDSSSMKSSAENGDAIGLIVDFSAMQFNSKDIALRLFSPSVYFDCYFVYPKDLGLSKHAESFIRFSQEWYQNNSHRLLHMPTSI